MVTLVVAAAALRLPGLTESLWYDEVNYSTSSGVSSLPRLWSYAVNRPEAPLYRALLFLWNEWVGDHAVAVRLPSLVSGLLCVFLTWRLARVCFDRSTALLAAFLLSLSPVHVWYSQEAAPYSLTLLLFLAAVVVWQQLLREGGSRGQFVAYAGLILAAVWTHYYAVAFLLPLTLLALKAPRPARWWILGANCLAGASVVLALGAKLATGHLMTEMSYLRPFTPLELWMLLLHWFPTGNTIWTLGGHRPNTEFLVDRPLLVLCQLALLALLLLGLAAAWRRLTGPLRWLLPLALATLPGGLLVATALGFDHLYIERYLLLLLPFFLIAVACGVTALPLPWARRLAAVFVIGLSLAAWLMMRVRDDAWTVYKPNPDWRAAARLLEAESIGQDGAVVVSCSNGKALRHYLDRHHARSPEVGVCRMGSVDERVAAGDVEGFFLVRNAYWDSGYGQTLRRWTLDGRLRTVGTMAVKGIDIHAFRAEHEPAATSRRRNNPPPEDPDPFGDGFESGDTSEW